MSAPERISFSVFFGLIKKTLPWRLIYLPTIPGTDLEIGFIQYDPDPKDQIKQYLTPNSDEKGITGIHSATISLPLTPEAVVFLQKVFSEGKKTSDSFLVNLDSGNLTFEDSPKVQTLLFAETIHPNLKGKGFRILDVCVQT